MIENKGVVALILLGKIVGISLYHLHGRHDAPKPPTAATVPGVWADHDNFHVVVLATLMVQLWAASQL